MLSQRPGMTQTPTRPTLTPGPTPPPKTVDLTEDECLQIDMAMDRYKIAGGHHRDNDARAFQLQQQHQSRDYP